ncbi:SMP-30/gluconolactonase/LRE family protein [Endobacterium cereale]|uniref:SMP-30/gluconolactonase/LRE family protein n=1 Tax=Endobacterium cereale TaxID=2663029 RepID=UPI002B46DB0E|nr:SMP-30/gluconolactonase/LRE family protein [Endobacterium cereale]MEB2846746.1 SMP-30/gluconolactonase/LRE family protein [Endobacterium cereale]
MTDIKVLDDRLPPDQLGEGAFWDGEAGTLYWVDIERYVVHRYYVETAAHQSWKLSKHVSFAYPQDGHLILCLADGVYRFDPETGIETPIAVLNLPNDYRLNDGKLDPFGRLWLGTINTSEDPAETAALYVLRGDVLEEVESGYVNANGKAWSPDGQVMYHADTDRGTIWQYDYDGETGTVTGKRVLVKIPEGNPDGLCTDQNGNIIAAMYGDGCLKVYSFRGDEKAQIDLPVSNPTSCVLVGSNLYVTTAYDGLTEEERKQAPDAGRVFVARYPLPNDG